MLTILVFLLILSLLVLAHEFGHYFIARLSGMTVEEFGIGFPPRLFAKKDAQGTVWSVNAIPLGGFVRIFGESGNERDRFLPGAFATKKASFRAAVLFGGVLMNVLVAWVLFSGGFVFGLPTVLEGVDTSSMIVSDVAVHIVEVLPDSPAAQAGLLPGDQVKTIDGVPFSAGDAARQALAPHADNTPLAVTVLRADAEVSVSLLPLYNEGEGRSIVGVALVETGTVRYPWYVAPFYGAEVTVRMLGAIIVGFFDLLSGLFTSADVAGQLSGPVGIAQLTGQILDIGPAHLVQFIAMLSLNLAVLNILPFPALDGGRLFFLFIEVLRRKPLSARAEQSIHGAGFALLLLLVVFVTYQDIARLAS